MRTRLSLSFAIACALAPAPALLITDQCFAQSETRLELAPQPLSAALRALGNQTKTNILFDPAAVKDLNAPAVIDAIGIEDALTKILVGSGLTYRFIDARTVTLIPLDVKSHATSDVGSMPNGRQTVRLAQAPEGGSQSDVDPSGMTREAIEMVVVTGTRIQRSGFTTPTPVTVVGSGDFEARATTNIADYLNDLPAFLPSQTPTTNTIATGGVGNFLNLRGLGGERTLLLVDGRRHVPTTNVGTVSINVIPTLLIDRVEVVTGGASAAYGSDAVAGVVNMIFDRDLEGFRGEVQSGIAEEGDNEEWRVALAFGTHFAEGRGHFSIAAEGFDNDGIQYQRDRSWGARDWGIVINPAYAPGNGEPQKLLLPDAGLSMATEGGLILSGPFAGMQFAPDGSLTPFNPGYSGGGLIAQGGDGPYAGSQAVLAVPLKRHNIFARGSYDISDNVTALLEASYAQQEANNRNLVQPFNFGDILIRADNAFLAPELRAQLVAGGVPGFALSRLNTDFGFVQANDKVDTKRAVAGLRGNFGESWTWDAYYQYGRSERENIDPGNVIKAKMAQAVDAVIDPISGDAVCRSGAPGCVPLNVLGFGAPSQAALDYIHGTASVFTLVEQDVLAASMQGTAFDNWAGPVSVAFGAEYRKDSVRTAVDSISASDGFLIGNQKPVQGEIEVKEAFTEIVMPLLSDLPLAQSSELNVAARVTDYSTSGSVTTWKAGLSHVFNDAIRLRATRSRDIRAPNVFELYSRSGTGFWPVTDPLTGTSLLVQSTLFPNPGLQPEEADTTVLGIVLQPAFVPRLRLSVDYFDIELQDAIGQLAPPDILNRCAAGVAALCDYVVRDGSGNIVAVNRSQLNLVERRIRGVDFEAHYSLPLSNLGLTSSGVLGLRLLATYTDELSYNDGSMDIDQAGALAGDGSLPGLPRVRGYGSVSYSDGPLVLHLGARYVGAADRDNSDPPLEFAVDHFPSQVYLDTSIQYTLLSEQARRLQLFANVSNLLDEDPVITGRDVFFSAATNPLHYDVIGRAYSAGVRFSF
jgi:outer membrane receptor protein involved in Fe transport